MIPAIGYSMCTADRSRHISTASLDPQFTAVEIDLGLSNGLDASLTFSQGAALHARSVPVGSADCRTEPTLARLADIARKRDARAVIARLGAMPAVSAGASAGSRRGAWKAESADLCRQVEFVQSRLGEIPFYLESKVEAECFTRNSHAKCVLRKVLAATGCGWFLDVTALYVEAMNSAQDPCDFLEEVLPAADRVQLTLTGVFFDEKAERWVASDAHAIPEAVFELYAFVLEVAFDKVDTVFVRQQTAKAEDEMQTVREIAEGVSAIV
jgi:uncharacterized protein (UPF0276 family)